MFIIILLLMVSIASAQDIELEWDHSSSYMSSEEYQYVCGYRVYIKDIDQSQSEYVGVRSINVENLSNPDVPGVTIYALQDEKFFNFVVTAYDCFGTESDYSNEIMVGNDLPEEEPETETDKCDP